MKTVIKNVTFIHGDCMDFLRECPHKEYDLAIVDPPYGIGEDGGKNHSRGKLAKPNLYTPKDWDREKPSKEYFDLISLASRNFIAWGANHYFESINRDSPCWVVWDKVNGGSDFADCELAYTSFKSAVRKFEFRWQGMLQGNMKKKEVRIHPTQKPVQLYKWLLINYAQAGHKILDTHGGSGSIAIACYELGYELTIIEKDKEYYENMVLRFKQHTSQLKLF